MENNNQETMSSPWTGIWLYPRQTIRLLFETNPQQHFLLLVAVGGLAQALSTAATLGLGARIPVSELLLICVIAGPISGFAALYLRGWILTWVCKKMGGVASFFQTRICIAWSWAPMVYTFPLWGVKYILFRKELFLIERPLMESQAVLGGLFELLGLVDFVVFVWSMFILFSTLSEINQFSVLRSIGAVILSGLILALPAMVLMGLFGSMVPM